MGIPSPLAFPPTALRNVAAGLVVGNPFGSSGTRAKALTSAELKAIVEASGISYLPLAGGTLTGPITGTGGIIQQRSGLNAQCYQLHGTYTSDSSREWLDARATGSAYEISSARGSAGGSNRNIYIGHRAADGTFTSGLIIYYSGGSSLLGSTGVYQWESFQGHFALGRNSLLGATSAPIVCGGDLGLAASSSASGGVDTRLRRNGSGSVAVISGDSLSTTHGDMVMSSITLSSLPTSDPGVSGRVWRDGATLKISV